MEEAILFLDLGGHSKTLANRYIIFFLWRNLYNNINGCYYITCDWKTQSYFLIWASTQKSLANSDIIKYFLVAESIQKYEEVPIMRPANGIGKPIS